MTKDDTVETNQTLEAEIDRVLKELSPGSFDDYNLGLLPDEDGYSAATAYFKVLEEETLIEVKAAILKLFQEYAQSMVVEELEKLSLDVIESCEPECDAVRHALHQGSWNAHLKIEDRIKDIKSQGSKEDSNGV